jgi:serine protease Do
VLKLEVLRGQDRKTIYVPAVEHHDPMDQLLDAVNIERSLIPRLGILAIDFTTDLSAAVGALRIPSGVLVVGRAADLIRPETGLLAGDVIHQLNTTPIQTMEALQTAVRQLKAGDSVALQVERDNGLRYESFEME